MRLFYKVYIFLILMLIVILAGAGYISYRREVSLFNEDMKKDALLLGNALSGMVEHTWKVSGPEKALELIRDANTKERSIGIRWVNLDPSAAGMEAPTVPLKEIAPLLQGEPVSLTMNNANRGLWRFTYIPVFTEAGAHRAIELSESFVLLDQYMKNSLFHFILTAALILLAAGGVLWYHFKKWIHKPLALFIDKSRRIGQGDLAPDLVVRGRDEFAILGETLNAMCRDLAASLETVRRESEQRIEALEQLRHSERLATLGRLSAGMAHEIGTPLNVISGRSRMIRAGDLAHREVVEFAAIIEEQTRRITKIMQGLLDFARRRKPDKTPQDVETIVKQVLDMLAPAASKAKAVFKVIRHGDIPKVPMDTIQVQQVLTNIVLNGIQAMEKGGQLEVELDVERKSHPEADVEAKAYLSIRIKDEGKGIPAEHLQHLFDPFFTTKEVGQGTGLGLSIAYGIIEEHGGWIEVDSTPGQGTCFTVFLPF